MWKFARITRWFDINKMKEFDDDKFIRVFGQSVTEFVTEFVPSLAGNLEMDRDAVLDIKTFMIGILLFCEYLTFIFLKKKKKYRKLCR